MGVIWRNHDVYIAFFVKNSIILNFFCSHILLCNILTVILRPNFEEPLDTAKQLVEQNITLYMPPAYDIWIQFLLQSPVPEYNILGENMIIADDWGHFDNISKYDVLGTGTHAMMIAYLLPYELDMGRWYRSKEIVAGKYNYGPPYLTNKKWYLNEVFSFKQFVHPLLLI